MRVTFSVAAWILLGAAAFFIFQTEHGLAERRSALGEFDRKARDAESQLADLRAAQQAYLATGQSEEFWMPKVDALAGSASSLLDDLRTIAVAPGSATALLEASALLTEFQNVDRRARDYLDGGHQLMAGDVIFTEGGETAAMAAQRVETARLGEVQSADMFEARQRQMQGYAFGAAGGVSAFLLAWMALAAGSRRAAGPTKQEERGAAAHQLTQGPQAAEAGLNLRQQGASARLLPAEVQPRNRHELLKAAAHLCTEFGRVNDSADLPPLLKRGADLMDASGLIVWMGDTTGSDLRPALSHGYTPQMLARMPAVPRSATNAAAAAYRTGKMQIVLARPGVSSGAIVAPLLSPVGCIGALSAEINGGGEASDAVQALAALVAAQLSTVAAASLEGAAAEATLHDEPLAEPRSASA